MLINKLLSGLPDRTMDQVVFDAAVAQLMADLPTWGGEVNATAAAMNMIAAGGAYALGYMFDTTTTDADPGAGKLRLSSATQNAATVIRLDLTSGGADYSSVIDTFDASTSTVKGSIRLTKFGDLTKWMQFDVFARAAPTGYRNLTVVCTGSSSASPFANGDGILLHFQRAGDRGDVSTFHVRDEKAPGTNGGSSVAGATTRVLNTIKRNTIPSASLSGNQFVLPVGTYRIRGSAPARAVGAHQAWIYNVTDNSIALVGGNEFAGSDGTRSRIEGEIVIAAAKTFELRHYTVSGVATNGLGGATGSGQVEVYSELIIEKVA